MLKTTRLNGPNRRREPIFESSSANKTVVAGKFGENSKMRGARNIIMFLAQMTFIWHNFLAQIAFGTNDLSIGTKGIGTNIFGTNIFWHKRYFFGTKSLA